MEFLKIVFVCDESAVIWSSWLHEGTIAGALNASLTFGDARYLFGTSQNRVSAAYQIPADSSTQDSRRITRLVGVSFCASSYRMKPQKNALWILSNKTKNTHTQTKRRNFALRRGVTQYSNSTRSHVM